jgi:hypothetical protein
MSGSGRDVGTPSLIGQPHGEAKSSQEPTARRETRHSQEGGHITPPVKEPAAPNKAAVTQPQAQTAQPDPYRLRDLIAQEEQAAWAFGMLIAAIFTCIITSIGTFLIWRQVSLTRKAVQDTGEATIAMQEANRIALDAHRPWLHFSLKVFQHATFAEVYVTFQNSGNSPAIDVRWQLAEFDNLSEIVMKYFSYESTWMRSKAIASLPPRGSETYSQRINSAVRQKRNFGITVLYKGPGSSIVFQTTEFYRIVKISQADGTIEQFNLNDFPEGPDTPRIEAQLLAAGNGSMT